MSDITIVQKLLKRLGEHITYLNHDPLAWSDVYQLLFHRENKKHMPQNRPFERNNKKNT